MAAYTPVWFVFGVQSSTNVTFLSSAASEAPPSESPPEHAPSAITIEAASAALASFFQNFMSFSPCPVISCIITVRYFDLICLVYNQSPCSDFSLMLFHGMLFFCIMSTSLISIRLSMLMNIITANILSNA